MPGILPELEALEPPVALEPLCALGTEPACTLGVRSQVLWMLPAWGKT